MNLIIVITILVLVFYSALEDKYITVLAQQQQYREYIIIIGQ